MVMNVLHPQALRELSRDRRGLTEAQFRAAMRRLVTVPMSSRDENDFEEVILLAPLHSALSYGIAVLCAVSVPGSS